MVCVGISVAAVEVPYSDGNGTDEMDSEWMECFCKAWNLDCRSRSRDGICVLSLCTDDDGLSGEAGLYGRDGGCQHLPLSGREKTLCAGIYMT